MSRQANARTTGEAERDIRARLEQLQDGTQNAPATNEGNDLVVTKDGQIVPPGEPIPTDRSGNPKPTLVVPEATFHAESE